MAIRLAWASDYGLYSRMPLYDYAPKSRRCARFSPSKLKDLGMTKYVKTSDGSYARTVGRGPKMIRQGDDD